ncbi:L-methionine/D-methionine ABC transporter ATP binding subunit [Azospirillaceae bacterium]
MISLQNVGKVFNTRAGSSPVRALDDVTLSVAAGEIFGVIGPSGAGKSTLIRTVNLLERPDVGRVTVNGLNITDLSGAALRAARRGVGMIFQHFNLLSSRTAFDNVALPLELAKTPSTEIRRKVGALLELVGLDDKRDHYPAELSGGQKQRIGIARALATDPKVLLCDEATSALDPETTRAILRLLADINRRLNLTILLITHEMTVITELCRQVAVMERGRIIEQGKVLDVFAQPRARTTQALVKTATGGEPPETVTRNLLSRPEPGSGVMLRVVFRGDPADQPLISRLSRRFGVDMNLRHGRLDVIDNASFGVLTIEITGPSNGVQAATAFFQSHQLDVEVLGYVPANLRAVG